MQNGKTRSSLTIFAELWIKNDRTLLAKSPGLPRRATIGCDNPPLPKRSCSFVAVSAMNEQAIDFANSIRTFLLHALSGPSQLRCESTMTSRCRMSLSGRRWRDCRMWLDHDNGSGRHRLGDAQH